MSKAQPTYAEQLSEPMLDLIRTVVCKGNAAILDEIKVIVDSRKALKLALIAMLEGEGEHSVGCKEFAPGYDDSRCCPVNMARAALRAAKGAA